MTVKLCDHRSVGALILRGGFDHMLMFDRVRPPVGVAPVAGHVDEHGTHEDAIRAEISEEVWLTAGRLQLTHSRWLPNRCRRDPGGQEIGHHWSVYEAEVTGDLAAAPDETRNLRWLTLGEVSILAKRTVAYAQGDVPEAEWQAEPGLEPAWLLLLSEPSRFRRTWVSLLPEEIAAVMAMVSEGRGVFRPGGPVGTREYYAREWVPSTTVV